MKQSQPRVFGFLVFAGLMLSTSVIFASPLNLTYQGRVVKSDGTPLEYSNVSFIFEIANPTGSCVIYREQVDGINMVNSKGVFDVPIGMGTRLFPTGPVYKFSTAFENSTSHSCYGGATFTALEDDNRVLKVQFHDGSGWKQISPNNIIRSVPYALSALSAMKLGNLTSTDFVLKTNVPGAACSAGQVITYDGTNFNCVVDAGGSGVVSDVLAGTGINVSGTSTKTVSLETLAGVTAGAYGSATSVPSVTVDNKGRVTAISTNPIAGLLPTASGVGGKYLKSDGTSWSAQSIQFSDIKNSTGTSAFNTGACAANQTVKWSSLTDMFECQNIGSLDASMITTGTISAARLPTGVATQWNTSGSNIYYNTGNVGIGTSSPSYKLDVAGDVNVTGNFKVNGVNIATGGGTVTNVSSVNGDIGVATGSSTPVLTLNSGTGANQIAKLDGTGKLPSSTLPGSALTTSSSLAGDVSGTSTTTSVDKIKGKTVAPVAYSAGQTLRYDGTNWVNAVLGFSDVSGTVTTAQLPTIPVSKGGTGTTTLAANRILASDGTGSAVTTFTCSVGQLVTFDAAGVMGCTSFSSSGIFANGGNSFGTAATLGTNDNFALNLATNGTTRMTLLPTGNVGIGTSTPGVALDVVGDLRSSTAIYAPIGYLTRTLNQPNVAASPSYSFIYSGDTGMFEAGGAGSHKIGFSTSGAERVRIDDLGNVGIGTTAPAYKLDVAGDVNVTGNFKVNGVNIATGGGTVTNVSSANADIGIATGSSTPVLTLNSGTGANQIVKLDGAGKLPTATLPSSVLTTTSSLTGDVSGTSTTTSVDKIKGTALSITTLTSGNYLKYNGTSWVNVTPSSADLSDVSSIIKASQMPANCAAGQTLTFSSPTGTWACSNIVVTASNFGSQTANTFLAAPNGSAGTPAFRTIASADLPAGTLSGSGTSGYIPYYNASTTLGNSEIFQSGSNVGIGTTSPSAKLHVGGVAGVDGIRFPDGTLQTSAAVTAGTNNSMITNWPDTLICNFTNPNWGVMVVPAMYMPYVVSGSYIYRVSAGGGQWVGAMFNSDGTFAGADYHNGTTYFTSGIVSNCNTSIAANYAAGRAFNIAKGPAAQWLQSGNNAYYNAGNVGIGTNNPTQKLTVAGTIESTAGGVKYPDGNTQTSAFQKTMTIRTSSPGNFFLANGGSVGYSASCQAGEIATGGGCSDSGFKMFYQMIPSPTSYTCYWYNTSGADVTITGATIYVNCLK